jgi:hypothetical protein
MQKRKRKKISPTYNFRVSCIKSYPPPLFLIAVLNSSGTLLRFLRISKIGSVENESCGSWKRKRNQ